MPIVKCFLGFLKPLGLGSRAEGWGVQRHETFNPTPDVNDPNPYAKTYFRIQNRCKGSDMSYSLNS